MTYPDAFAMSMTMLLLGILVGALGGYAVGWNEARESAKLNRPGSRWP